MVKFAISGKANSGKNTTASLLGLIYTTHINDLIKASLSTKASSLGSIYTGHINSTNFKILGFADPIKEMIMKMYPTTNPDILWGASELRKTLIPNSPITYRTLLTDIGKLGRGYNVNVWVDATISMSNMYSDVGNVPIISDCRFKNEFFTLKKEGFFLIRVIRPNNPQNPNISQDISETDLDDISDSMFDTVLINDSSIEDLKSKIYDLIKSRF